MPIYVVNRMEKPRPLNLPLAKATNVAFKDNESWARIDSQNRVQHCLKKAGIIKRLAASLN